MKRIIYLFLAVICLIVSGCGVNSTSYQNSNNNTNVMIQDSQFRYVKKVKGECNQMYVFGAGLLDKGTLTNNAIQDMYDKANLKDGQAIINITTTVSKKIYFPLIATKRFATAYGMVIEFTDKNAAGRHHSARRYAATDDDATDNDSKSYEQWEKKQRNSNERVSAEYNDDRADAPRRSTDSRRESAAAQRGGTDESADEEESGAESAAATAATAAAAPAKEMTYPTTDKYTFTVADGRKVVFAPGNLQYNAGEKEWRFAGNQYAALGTKNSQTGMMDLYCWGTGDRPTTFTKFATDFSDFEEWGRNPIANGGKNQWRTLTSNEWYYLLNKRDEAKARFTLATVNGVAGLLILPDNLKLPMKNRYIAGKGGTKASDNKYSAAQWKKMEEKGCVFLPVTGWSDNGKINKAESVGYYWSASSGSALSFSKDYIYPRSTTPTNRGCAVRLVREAR